MRALLLFLCAGSVLHLAAQWKPLENSTLFKTKFSEVAASTLSIKADYTQSKHSDYFAKPLVSKGVFLFDHSGKMRWEQSVPDSYIILISGDQLSIKKNGKIEKHALSTNNYYSYLQLLMMGTTNGKLLNSRDFTYQYFSGNSGYLVKLLPKNKKLSSFFSYINLEIDTKYRLKSMKMVEKSGDYTLIEFSNAVFNIAIDPKKFSTL